jgi:hypothetical protein
MHISFPQTKRLNYKTIKIKKTVFLFIAHENDRWKLKSRGDILESLDWKKGAVN